jgi:hypothetical protein
MNVMRFRTYTLPAPTPEDTATERDLVILPADRMRAERFSTTLLPPSQRGAGAVQSHAETWVLLWLWCAATRLQQTAASFDEYADTVVAYDRLDANGEVIGDDTDTDEIDPATVDPTQQAAATT